MNVGIDQIKEKVLPILKEAGVTHSSLFGSYIRGENKDRAWQKMVLWTVLIIQDAVVRRLEIIGKAVKHIPDEIKQKHREVEWKKIAGARDIFAHEYFGVRLERVWDTITREQNSRGGVSVSPPAW